MSDHLRRDWRIVSWLVVVIGLMADAAVNGWAPVISGGAVVAAFVVFLAARTIREGLATRSNQQEAQDG